MKKPYVICHMCTSIDGRIMGDRWGKVPGSGSTTSIFETTADTFGIPAWLVGTVTMKEFAAKDRKLPLAKHKIDRVDQLPPKGTRSFAIGADAKAVLRFSKNETGGDHIVVLLTERASNDYLAHLQKVGVSYLFCGARELDLPLAMDKMRRLLGIRKLMLEGGGMFNGAVLHAGLVDEISQVIVPVVDGGMGVQTFFDIRGDAPKRAAAHLRLKSHKQLRGGVTWLRYKVIANLR